MRSIRKAPLNRFGFGGACTFPVTASKLRKDVTLDRKLLAEYNRHYQLCKMLAERQVEKKTMDFVYMLMGFCVSLSITLVAYGTFPLAFTRIRKKPIAKKTCYAICYAVNFVIWIGLIVFDLSKSPVPYILWTGIFTKIAAEPIHDAASASEQTEMPEDEAHEQAQEAIELPAAAPPILFCRRCGLEVAKGGAHSAMPKL